VGVARVVIRSKEQLVAIRPRDDVLTMETLLFGDEVVSPDSLADAPAEKAKTSKKEVDMAMQLIDSLATDFDPSKYRDEYRDTVLDMIERKAQGHEIAVQEAPEEPAEVPDLMAALEASIAAAKRQGGTRAAAADGDGAAKPKSGSKGRSASKGKSSAKRSKPAASKSAAGNGSKPRARKRASAKK
jgi:DNA end-binding protein Ku